MSNECACGCGRTDKDRGSRYSAGHDGKLLRLIHRVQDGLESKDSIPAIAYEVLGTCLECGLPAAGGHRGPRH